MEALSQSTYLPIDAELAWKVLAQTPRSFPLGRSTPSLVYVARNGLKVGASVEMALHFGVYKLDWKATVVDFSSDKGTLELRLAEPGFLLDYRSQHKIVGFGEGASILREKVEFKAKDAGIQNLLEQASMMHAIRERMVQCGLAVSDTRDTEYGLSAISDMA